MGSFAQRLPSSSGASSGAPTIAQQLSQLGIDTGQFQKEVPSGSPQGIGGWLGGFASNVLGDVSEFAQGMGALGGNALSDIVTAGTDVLEEVTPMRDTDRSYTSDDLAKSLVFDPDKFKTEGLLPAISPGMQTYAEEAYGINPLKADLLPDIKKVGSSLYNDPLNTALDVFGGVSAVGRRMGKNAVKRFHAGAPIDDKMKRTLPGLDPESPLFDDPKAATFSGEQHPGGVRRSMVEYGGKPSLVTTPQPINPVTRGIRNKLYTRASIDIDSMPPEVKTLADEVAKAPDSEARLMELNALQPELAQNIRLYNQAKEWGVTRLDKPKVAQYRVKAEGAKRIANWRGSTYFFRNEDIKAIQEAFDAYDLDEGQIKGLYKAAQGYEPRKAVGMLPFQAVRQMIDSGGDWLKQLPMYDDIVQRWDEFDEHLAKHADDPEEVAATVEYAEDLSEFLEVQRQVLAKQPLDAEAATIAHLRWARHGLIAESIKAGNMKGYLTNMRRTYGPMLAESFAPRLDDIDPTTGRERFGKFEFDKLTEDNPDFWKIARNSFKSQDLQAPIYYPHLDARKMKKSDLLLRSSSSGMRNAIGDAPFSRNEYKNFIQGTYLTDDPVQAYSVRAAQMRRIVETEKFIESITERFGRKVGVMDELGPNEKYFSPLSFKQLFRSRAEIDHVLSRAAVELVDDDTFGVAIKETVAKLEHEAANALTRPEMKDVYAIPAAVAKQLESFSKYQVGPMGRIFWDGPVNVWRSAVLAFSPRWILNNLLGNVVFLKMQGGKLSEVLQYAFSPNHRKRIDEFIETLPHESQAQVGEGLFGSTQQQRTSLGAAEATDIGQAVSKLKESKVVKPFSWWARRMEHWNENIEVAFRKVSLTTAIDKQKSVLGLKRSGRKFFRSMAVLEDAATNGITPKLLEKAVDDMNYFFNDYRKMSSFERNVLRRGVMPFWSFYKHVGKLVLSYPFTHPERATAIRTMGAVADEIEADYQGLLPEYLRNSIPIGGGTQEGDTRFLNTRGANPFELVTQIAEDPFGAPAGMLGPQAGVAYELMSGRDALTGRQFTSPGVGSGFGSDRQYKATYDEAGNITGVESAPTNVRPGIIESLLGQVPQPGVIRNLLSEIPGVGAPGVGARYSTGEEIVEGGANKYPLDNSQKLMQLLGISTTDLNVDEHLDRQATERQQALTTILRNYGYLAPTAETP